MRTAGSQPIELLPPRGHWVGGEPALDAAAGENMEVVLDGSLRRVEAGFGHARAAPGSDEGKVRRSPRQNVVAGDLDVLIQDPQLLVANRGLVDGANKRRIIEKLFYPELR